MKKAHTKAFSILLAAVLILSLGTFTAFAAGEEESQHVHTEECMPSEMQSPRMVCTHPVTRTVIEGEDVYYDSSCHDSYEVTNVYCDECGFLMTTYSRSIGKNAHNSRVGYYVDSFVHIADGTKHLTTYRRTCTCGYIYTATTETLCNCPKP